MVIWCVLFINLIVEVIILQKRGVMNVNGSLPYFPYRDDGLLLWEQVGKFAKEYVDM